MNLLDSFLEDQLALPPILKGTEQRREVWICIREEGVFGDGTLENPYNGSGRRFDEVMRDANRITANMTIRLGPGRFVTLGGPGNGHFYKGFFVRAGQRIVGSGRDSTVLQLVGMTQQDAGCTIIGAPVSTDNFEISDLTLDCNLHRQMLNEGALNKIMVHAIDVPGRNTVIRRIRVINFGSTAKQHECFPIFLHGPDLGDPPYVHKGNPIIEDVIVEYPHQANIRETTVLSAYGDIGGVPSVIRNNYVNCEFANPQYEELEVVVKTVAGSSVRLRTKWPHCLQKNDIIVVTGTLTKGGSPRFRLDDSGSPNDGKVIDDWTIELNPDSSQGTASAIRLIGVYDSEPTLSAGDRDQLLLPSLEIESLTYSAGKAVLKTAAPHQRRQDDWIRVSGVWVGSERNSSYNGSFRAEYVDETTLRYVIPNPGGAGEGEMYLDRVKTPYARVSSFSVSGFVATMTTYSAHFRRVGEWVRIAGIFVPSGGSFSEVYAYGRVTSVTVPVASGLPWGLVVEFTETLPDGYFFSALIVGATFQGMGNGSGVAGTADQARGNRIYNCTIGGPYQDTHNAASIWVCENYYYNVAIGPYKNVADFAKFERLMVEENVIQTRPHLLEVNPSTHPTAIVVNGTQVTTPVEVVIVGNITRIVDGLTSPHPGVTCVRIDGVDSVVIRDNVAPLFSNPNNYANVFPFVVSGCGNVTTFNNQTTSGEVVNVRNLWANSAPFFGVQGNQIQELKDDIDDYCVLEAIS